MSTKTPQQPTTELDDQAFMQRVLDLAAKGYSTTHPNPRVGCVIVNDGEIVAEGYHEKTGEAHAERVALRVAGDKARGGTAYVNLEPCCHQGRTPPCTDGLIDAGITRVVAAMCDPNPMVSGGGVDVLKEAGITVETGLMKQESLFLNKGFVQRMSRQKPWVILKSAATLDGRTADFDGNSKWITGESARAEVQKLRASCSAVLTGIGTVLADDPQLNVRAETAINNTGESKDQSNTELRQPMRVVLDSQLQIPLDSKIIGTDDNLVVFTLSQDNDKISQLIELGVEVIQQTVNQKNTETQKLDLDQVLTELAKWECNEVLVEAGQTLSGAFLSSGLVDELILFYAGSLLGDQGKSMFAFDAPLPFSDRVEYRVNSVEMVDTDFKVIAISETSLQNLLET